MYTQELKTAQELALKASKVILDFYSRDFSITDKPDDEGPVTEADIAANDVLLAGLTAAFPDDAILSEESADDKDRLKSKRVWCIDPIDGTREFIARNDEFAIHIGLIIDNKAAFGLVHLPVKNISIWGGPDMGSFMIDHNTIHDEAKRIQCNDHDRDNIVLIATRSHFHTHDEELKLKLNAVKQFRFGSVGGKAYHLATGQADLFFYSSPCTKSWDSCAPEAIVRGAGGMVSDINGNPLLYNREDTRNNHGVIFSNGSCHQDVVDIFKKVCHPT